MNKQTTASTRLTWLDMLRGLCALEIIGLHWLRACMHANLFVNTSLPENFRSFIWSDKNNNQGFQMLQDFPDYFMLDNQNNLAAGLINFVGILFGFGWEALDVFILISGFSLTLKLTAWPNQAKDYWLSWYKRRWQRIILPYYLIVIIMLSSFLCFYLVVNLLHIPFFAPIQAQLQDKIDKQWLSLLFSHLFLIDFWETNGNPTFFATAWWFIPAILGAYISFPFFFWLLTKFGRKFLLFFGFLVTTIFYGLHIQNIWQGNVWFYIITFELFNFSLGMVIGNWYQSDSNFNFQNVLFNPITLLGGLLAVVAGNVMNWFTFLYPFSSIFFTCGLMILGANLSKLLLKVPFVRKLKNIDFYILYLIHQPFAYLIVLLLSRFLKRYTTFFGIFIYLFVVLSITSVFSKTYTLVEKRLNLWTQKIPSI